jgi:hypothetical protein
MATAPDDRSRPQRPEEVAPGARGADTATPDVRPEDDAPLAPDPPGTGPGDPEERLYSGVELEAEDGSTWVPRQQAVGKDAAMGGGEFADPATPAEEPAPGATGGDGRHDEAGGR